MCRWQAGNPQHAVPYFSAWDLPLKAWAAQSSALSPRASQLPWESCCHFALPPQPLQHRAWCSRSGTPTRRHIFSWPNVCWACLSEQPRFFFLSKVTPHALFSGQEARTHGSSPHFSQMLWITPSPRSPGGAPGLPQLQLCLFRCRPHAQREQSSRRPSSHHILGSDTKREGEKKSAQGLQASQPSLKGLHGLSETTSGSSLSLLLLQNKAFLRRSKHNLWPFQAVFT